MAVEADDPFYNRPSLRLAMSPATRRRCLIMSPARHRVRLGAVVLTSCFALCGCALQSSRPAAAAGEGGSQGPPAGIWRYARTITLDTTAAGANVPDAVENYPLAVRLDKSRFDFSQARSDGVDIRFFDAGGKALPHAIDRHDRLLHMADLAALRRFGNAAHLTVGAGRREQCAGNEEAKMQHGRDSTGDTEREVVANQGLEPRTHGL